MPSGLIAMPPPAARVPRRGNHRPQPARMAGITLRELGLAASPLRHEAIGGARVAAEGHHLAEVDGRRGVRGGLACEEVHVPSEPAGAVVDRDLDPLLEARRIFAVGHTDQNPCGAVIVVLHGRRAELDPLSAGNRLDRVDQLLHLATLRSVLEAGRHLHQSAHARRLRAEDPVGGLAVLLVGDREPHLALRSASRGSPRARGRRRVPAVVLQEAERLDHGGDDLVAAALPVAGLVDLSAPLVERQLAGGDLVRPRDIGRSRLERRLQGLVVELADVPGIRRDGDEDEQGCSEKPGPCHGILPSRRPVSSPSPRCSARSIPCARLGGGRA